MEKDLLDWTGHWWLPSDPNMKLAGVLHPAAEMGPALEMMGSFHTDADKQHEALEIVHGTTPTAAYVTLYNCVESVMSHDARGQYHTRYEVELAVTGEHFRSVDALAFSDLTVEYSTLVYWVARPVIDFKQLTDRGPQETISVLPPIHVTLHKGDGFALSLNYGARWTCTGDGVTLDVYPTASIGIEWDAPRPFPETLAVIQKFRDFLSFATCRPTCAEKINASPVHFTDIGHAHDMTLFHKSMGEPTTEKNPYLHLFSLKEVLSSVEHVLGAWFAKANLLQPVIDLHLAPIYNPQMQPDTQLLGAAQALEAFHRRTRGNQELTEEAHTARISQVLQGTPEQYRKWLEERLQYSNEPPLRTRLKGVFDEFRSVLENFTLKRKPFINSVCNTRNYLTHYDEQLRTAAAKGIDLQFLVYGLQLLLDVGLLSELRIDPDTIAQLARRRHMVLANP